VREVPPGQAVAFFQERIHRLPDRDHVGMLMSPVEAALDPGEDLDVGRSGVETAKDVRLVIGDEAEPCSVRQWRASSSRKSCSASGLTRYVQITVSLAM